MTIKFRLRNPTEVPPPPVGQVRLFPDKNALFFVQRSDGTRVPLGEGVSNTANTSITLVETTDTASVPRPSDGEFAIYIYNNTIQIIDDAGTITPVGGLTDGDKGDITVSSSGTVLTIDNNVVNYAKMQDVSATDRLLGRDTAGSGDVEELTVGGGVEFTGSGGIQRSALTGDVTASAGSGSTTIPNDTVTFAKMQNIATDRLLGRDTAGSGDPEEISLSTALVWTGSGGIAVDVGTSGAKVPLLNANNTHSGKLDLTGGGDLTPAATPSTTAIGYLGAPQISDQDDYTLVMADAGKHYYHTSATPHTLTIPANSSVAFPIGTIIAGFNENGAGNLTITVTSDTLRWSTSTGNRTIAANGSFSLTKLTATLWRLTGDGIS